MAQAVEVDAVPGLAVAGGVRAVCQLEVLTGAMSPEQDGAAAQSLISAPGRVVVVRVGQLRGERGRGVVVVLESVAHVVRGPAHTVALAGGVRARGGAGLRGGVRLGLRLLGVVLLGMLVVVVVVIGVGVVGVMMVVMMVVVVVVMMVVLMVLVSGLETAVVGRVVQGPGGPQLGWDVEFPQVERPRDLGRQGGGGRGRGRAEVGGAH